MLAPFGRVRFAGLSTSASKSALLPTSIPAGSCIDGMKVGFEVMNEATAHHGARESGRDSQFD